MEQLARTKTTQPPVSRETGQRSLDLPDTITRIIPAWTNPQFLMGETWRYIVKSQPIATICKETLIENMVSLEWKIEPRDSEMRDEYRPEVEYYTSLLENGGDLDWTQLLEFVLQDYLDLPFGGAVEVGRENDSPDGKVRWILPIDGATLFPSLNKKHPVGQYIKQNPTNYIWFPAHAINRIYSTPRTELLREGWGMAPPEKIYLALELLNRGDAYYANLLLDTPPPGILDLLDMEKDSAVAWLDSWKTLLGGVDPFKIPVLYGHEKAAQFVSFTKSPTELMFDKATLKYTAIVTAGYGMSIGDIGLPTLGSGGETLAGSIRQERRTRRTGFGTLKRKVKFFIDRILPKHLEFKWIDLDDELQVAVGRARLSSATAMELLVTKGIILPNEARQQLIADGLVTISMPESIDGGDEVGGFSNFDPNRQVGSLGNPVPPSQGGHGEIKASMLDSDALSSTLSNVFTPSDATIKRAIRTLYPVFSQMNDLYPEVVRSNAVHEWNSLFDTYLYVGGNDDIPTMIETATNIGIKRLSNSIPLRLVWSDDVVEYLKGVFDGTYFSNAYKKALLDYELGKSDVEPDANKIVLSPEIANKFNGNVTELLGWFGDRVVELFYRSIISGINKHLSKPEIAIKLADGLDIETFIGDNIVNDIRESLEFGCKVSLSEFSERFIEVSKQYLEDM